MPEERRETGSRDAFYEMVKDIHQKTNDLHTTMFGPKDQKELGFVHQTNARLKTVETRQWTWAGLIGLLSLAGAAIARKLGL